MSKREILDLGPCGKIPVDTLHELYLDLADGECLVVSQSKTARSLGSWVYNAAACLAKYLETKHFKSQCKNGGSLNDKRLIELGAGTGVVGLVASHYGAHSIITDLETLVPLIDYNIQQNRKLLKGSAVGRTLCWGDDEMDSWQPAPDFLVLANCVYYEGSLEQLAQTVDQLADDKTLVLACYEERTKDIKKLIQKWHDLIREKFTIEEVPFGKLSQLGNVEEFVRIVTMRKKGIIE